MNTTRIMVYSHDAFGLGNLRRMLAICEHLLKHWPNLSILLVSGSPMIHEFRLPQGLDYIKLPCLNRGVSGELSAKYLGTSIEETVALRSHLIYSAAVHFKPNLLLVDKKPTGLRGELANTLSYLQQTVPENKRVLLLRDILDTPEKTIDEWCRWGHHHAIQTHYDQVLVAGVQSVFDLVQEYRLPLPIAHKVRYCGYIRKQLTGHEQVDPRAQLGIKPTDSLVLVTPGGGEDGFSLVHTYLEGLKLIQALPPRRQTADDEPSLDLSDVTGPIIHSLILSGPEMPIEQRSRLEELAAGCSSISFQSFTTDLLSYLQAADAVVSMGGYNTLTEILMLGKRTVVVPRIHPSQEQLIRAINFAKKGWITMVHPEQVTGRSLIQAVLDLLYQPFLPPERMATRPKHRSESLDLNGLPQISGYLSALLASAQQPIPDLMTKSVLVPPFMGWLA
ncbi:Glycosyltransferase family 28 C-terminal domain [Synechococcus sp. PCC 7335]|uniref:glycosyltransferase family protein n=1 Tax=Synechococcus sp. (strain ATCC 29403 / PCC 7335) TaxID=91464 RepID=UPI00017EDFCE|nr:glycosyltransferase [Synechococcus sp. PCC 7335]EDX85697.1 Glycosyltransferase family 28 C-terminal domain [Synechococcus sp. PCC 7335]